MGLVSKTGVLNLEVQSVSPNVLKALSSEFGATARGAASEAFIGLGEGAKVGLRGSSTFAEMLGVAGIAAAVYFTTTEVGEKAHMAQKALEDGRLSPAAFSEYRLIMTGKAASVIDPSGILGAALVRGAFEDLADKYHLDKRTRDELAPSSLLFRSKSEAELKASYFFDRLPLAGRPDMPEGIRTLMAMKQQIYDEAFNHGRQSFQAGLLPDMMKQLQQQMSTDASAAYMTQLQQDFMKRYNEELKSGNIDAWLENSQNNMESAHDAGLPRLSIKVNPNEAPSRAPPATAQAPTARPNQPNYSALKTPTSNPAASNKSPSSASAQPASTQQVAHTQPKPANRFAHAGP